MQKGKINILLLNPEGVGGDVMREHVNRKEKVGEPHQRALKYINKIIDDIPNIRAKSRCHLKKTSWIPSCTMIIAKNKNGGFISLIGINGFCLQEKDKRRLYSVYKSNIDDQRTIFFNHHFDKIWNDPKSQTIDITNE